MNKFLFLLLFLSCGTIETKDTFEEKLNNYFKINYSTDILEKDKILLFYNKSICPSISDILLDKLSKNINHFNGTILIDDYNKNELPKSLANSAKVIIDHKIFRSNLNLNSITWIQIKDKKINKIIHLNVHSISSLDSLLRL